MKRKEAYSTYIRLFKSLRPYAFRFGISLIGLVCLAIADGVLYKKLIPYLIDQGFIDQNPEFLVMAPIYILTLFLIRGMSTFIASYSMAKVGRSAVREFRHSLLTKMMKLPSSYYEKIPSGNLISKVNYDTEQVAEALSGAISEAIRGLFIAISMLWVMFSTSWSITLIVLTVVPVLFVFLQFVSKAMRRYSLRVQATMGEVTRVTGEVVEGYQVIRVYSGQSFESKRIKVTMQENFIQEMKMYMASTGSVPAMQFIGAIALAGLVYMATTAHANISVGEFTGMFGAMLGLLRPIKQIAAVNSVVQRGIAAASSIFAILDEKEEEDTGTVHIDRAKGEIRISNMYFNYETSAPDSWCLEDISLLISPGQTVAFVGASGSGKSSLAKLLLRFYQVNKGTICLDGIKMESITLASLREQFSYVSQELVLFNDTIANNIAYGGNKSEATEEQIIAAAKSANVLEFANKLPEGLNTQIGENGVLLSGGQKQRIAIARAIIKNAPIILLDEATSALDAHSEKLVQEALEDVSKTTTTIIIAHRLSTVQNADKIFVMDDGHVVESGSHVELLEKNSHYANLIRTQSSMVKDVEKI